MLESIREYQIETSINIKLISGSTTRYQTVLYVFLQKVRVMCVGLATIF